MISCMGYPNCTNAAFLPKFVLEAQVVDDVCQICQPGPVQKVKLRLNPRNIPPYLEPEQIACICGCDEDMKNVLDIRFRTQSSSNQQSNRLCGGYSNSARGRGSHPSSGNGPGFLSRPNRRDGRGRGTKRTSGGQSKQYSGPSGHDSGYASSSSSARLSSSGFESSSLPCCRCGEVSVERTVLKDGPNNGRQFYTCNKPKGKQCGFFEWADAGSSSSFSSSSSNYSNQGTRYGHRTGSSNPSSRGSSSTRRPPTCGLCGEQGHTRRSCPNK